MSQALFTGASGLRAFQSQLDVIANNLANLNTTGFKSQQVQFSDLVYRNLRSAAGSDGTSFGGINPAQTGTGVQVAQIDRKFIQGALQETGQPLDFAIRGEGFFVATDQSGGQVFTRAGSFGLDANGNLVDPATGFLIQRTGTTGDDTAQQFGFQRSGDSRVNIPFGAAVPGQQTANVAFNGNLPSSALPPLAEVLSTSAAFTTSAGAATATTLFSDLTTNQSDYVAGETIEVLGTDADGTAYQFDLAADTATLGDLVNQINLNLNGAVAQLTASGDITITADNTGEAFLSLVIRDANSNVNVTDFGVHAAVVETEGGSGDTFESAVQVFDVQGNPQNVLLTFQKATPNSFDVTIDLPDNNGTILSSQPFSLLFNDNGTFSFVGASGTTSDLSIQFDTLSVPQDLVLSFDNLSHNAFDFGVSQNQDGAPPGILSNVAVSGDGLITGIASNGNFFPIAQLAIASFSNVDGLEGIGENYFQATTASGASRIGSGLSNGLGTIVGSQLETSNVDITQEFTQLIIAQRAFSANARTITVAEEILEELTNLVR